MSSIISMNAATHRNKIHLEGFKILVRRTRKKHDIQMSCESTRISVYSISTRKRSTAYLTRAQLKAVYRNKTAYRAEKDSKDSHLRTRS